MHIFVLFVIFLSLICSYIEFAHIKNIHIGYILLLISLLIFVVGVIYTSEWQSQGNVKNDISFLRVSNNKEDTLAQLTSDKYNIDEDTKSLTYLNRHKKLNNEKYYNKFLYKSEEKMSMFHTPVSSWKKYLYTEAIMGYNRKSLMKYLKSDRHSHINNLPIAVHDYSHYKKTYDVLHYKYLVGLLNVWSFIYLLLFIIVFSFLVYICKYRLYKNYKIACIRNGLLTKNDVLNEFEFFKNFINFSVREIIDKYIFHLLPLLIAFMSALLAILSNDPSEHLLNSWGAYAILIKYSIPVLTSIQAIRIILDYYATFAPIKHYIKKWDSELPH